MKHTFNQYYNSQVKAGCNPEYVQEVLARLAAGESLVTKHVFTDAEVNKYANDTIYEVAKKAGLLKSEYDILSI